MKTFKAKLERSVGRMNHTIIYVPLDVEKIWGVRRQLKVCGDINGVPFSSSLLPDGKGQHFLVINRKMQTAAQVSAGSSAVFRMVPDRTPRTVNVPAELIRALGESKQLARYYASLNSSTRRQIASWVNQGKQTATRARRADQMAERLMHVMLAEKGDLPPALELALRANGKARAGWKRMPPSERRRHLLAIFYYQSPESRSRRITKAVEAMVERASKFER